MDVLCQIVTSISLHSSSMVKNTEKAKHFGNKKIKKTQNNKKKKLKNFLYKSL